jgi:cytochrome c1
LIEGTSSWNHGQNVIPFQEITRASSADLGVTTSSPPPLPLAKEKKQVLQFNIKKNCQHCTSMDSEYHCGCSKIHLFQVNPVQKLRDVTCFAQTLACDVSRVPGPNEKQTNMTGMTVNALISLARPEPQPY